mmetsp:Transcript_130802/g.260957  ORF Transcript_130802/g.260957 Transcript_130802/m.260957 type:complete len:465 (+) Transcript_130802:76-1470(+)
MNQPDEEPPVHSHSRREALLVTNEPPTPTIDTAQNFEAAQQALGLGFASPVAGALVLANTLLGGSGMLGIPHALSVAGYGLGLVLIVCFGSFSAIGSHLLQCSARRIGGVPCSFYSVASATIPRWTWLVDGAVAVKCFGVGCSYLIIVGDLAPDSLRFFGAHGVRRWHTVTGAFLVAGALACMKNLNALRYTAVASILIVFWTCTLIALFFANVGDSFDPCAASVALAFAGNIAGQHLPCKGADFEPVAVPSLLKLGKVLPVFIFGFTCQQNVFTICNEVRRPTQNMDRIIFVAYVFAGFGFAITAFLGYATYGDMVKSDVLKGYPQDSVAVQLARFFFAVLATFSYPLQAHPSRASIMALWSLAAGPAHLQGPSAERRRFWLVTAVWAPLSLVVALTVTDLGIVLGVVGATGSTMVSYILPGLTYRKAFLQPSMKRTLAGLQLLLGCVIMPLCLIMLFVPTSK